jgi:hypothetical protein
MPEEAWPEIVERALERASLLGIDSEPDTENSDKLLPKDFASSLR